MNPGEVIPYNPDKEPMPTQKSIRRTVKTWVDIEKLLEGYPRSLTYQIDNLDTINEVIRGNVPQETDDFEILGTIYDAIIELQTKHKDRDMYVRVTPEISLETLLDKEINHGDEGVEKFYYCRLQFVEKVKV